MSLRDFDVETSKLYVKNFSKKWDGLFLFVFFLLYFVFHTLQPLFKFQYFVMFCVYIILLQFWVYRNENLHAYLEKSNKKKMLQTIFHGNTHNSISTLWSFLSAATQSVFNLFKVSNGNTRTVWAIYLKLARKTPERRQVNLDWVIET